MKYLKLVVFLLTFSVYSQNIELKWADKIKTKEYVSILGGKNGSYYTSHRDDDKNLVCRSYDKNLNLKDEKIVNFNLDSKKYTYSGAYFLKNKIVHFVEDHVRKEDKNYLYGAVTDLKLNTEDKTFVLDEANEDAIAFGSRRISPDSTKIMIYNEIKGKRKDPSILNFKVYDASFKDVLLNKSAELPIKAKNFSTENIGVDNLGNVFVLAKVYKEKKEKEKGQSLFYYKLIVFNKEDAPKEFDFDYPNKDIESIDIIPGENNTLMCTGFLKILDKSFFGTGKKSLISDEIFTSIIDCKTLALKSANNYQLEGLYPEKVKKSEDYVPYKVRNIFYRKDGGSVIVAEQYKLVVVHHYSKYGTTTSYKYYYCDIATINIDNKSEVESVSKMPKYQLNAGNPSIISTYFEGTTYIVYEDLEKNVDAENDKETKRSTKSLFSSSSKNALFLLSIAPSGEMKKEIIYSFKDSEIRPRILTSMVNNENEIILNADDQIGVLRVSSKKLPSVKKKSK
jgi:hypothetical protein